MEAKISDRLISLMSGGHYSDLASEILKWKKSGNHSERYISGLTGISKSEVHRLLVIARESSGLFKAAKTHDIEKYVLQDWCELKKGIPKDKLWFQIYHGKIRTRRQMRIMLNHLE